MKGCLESIFIVLLGCAAAGYILWHAFQNPEPVLAPAPDVQRELDLLKRQFQMPEIYRERLAGQQISETQLSQRIATALAEQNRLESRIPAVDEAAVRRWYNSNREKLRIPPIWHAAHVFLTRHDAAKPDREAEIRAIHGQITSGALTFEQAAARFSEDERTKALAGDLGWFSAERMPADLIAAVRDLRPGVLSEPVLTGLGWHIFRVIETRPSRLPEFEEVKAEIHALLDLQAREAVLKPNQR